MWFPSLQKEAAVHREAHESASRSHRENMSEDGCVLEAHNGFAREDILPATRLLAQSHSVSSSQASARRGSSAFVSEAEGPDAEVPCLQQRGCSGACNTRLFKVVEVGVQGFLWSGQGSGANEVARA